MLLLTSAKNIPHFDVDVVGETPDIIWWNLFKDIQTNFIQAVKTIVDCPRNRLVQKETYLRADKTKTINSTIGNTINRTS